jgi:hypothetical protein
LPVCEPQYPKQSIVFHAPLFLIIISCSELYIFTIEIARQLNRKVNEFPRKILHFAQLHNQRRQGAAHLWIKIIDG